MANGPAVRRTRRMGDGSTMPRYDVGALWSRVDTMSDEIHGIRQSIGALHTKLDERQRIPWGAVSAGIAFMAFISIFILFGLNAYVSSIGQTQMRIETALSNYAADAALAVDRVARQIDARFLRAEDQTGARVLRIEEDMAGLSDRYVEIPEADRMREAIVDIRGNTFPREVHQERWGAFQAELAHNAEGDRLLAAKVDAIYPTSSAINSIMERLDRVEGWITMGRASAIPASPPR